MHTLNYIPLNAHIKNTSLLWIKSKTVRHKVYFVLLIIHQNQLLFLFILSFRMWSDVSEAATAALKSSTKKAVLQSSTTTTIPTTISSNPHLPFMPRMPTQPFQFDFTLKPSFENLLLAIFFIFGSIFLLKAILILIRSRVWFARNSGGGDQVVPSDRPFSLNYSIGLYNVAITPRTKRKIKETAL